MREQRPPPSALVLAAGRGTRMRSTRPKPLMPVAGRPIALWLLDSFAAAGVTDVVAVVGYGAEQVQAALAGRARFALQAQQLGMAHAVASAREALGDAAEIFVFVGDGPLVRPESIRALLAHHRATDAAVSFLCADFPIDLPYARIIQDADGRVIRAVEARDADPADLAARRLLGSHYLFQAAALWRWLGDIQPHPQTGERYLTDILGLMLAAGERVEALVIPDWRELVGPNTPEELVWAEGVLADREAP